jgi:DUF971 family protein
MKPEIISQISDTVITIQWDDGHESFYFADHLRRNCPCALCEENRSGAKSASLFKILKSGETAEITFTYWRWIGRYAIGFDFSDGHTLGIYPYELLRSLCQCDLCERDSIRIQGPLRE